MMNQRMSFPVCAVRFVAFLLVVEAISYLVMRWVLGWPLWSLVIPAALLLISFIYPLEPDLMDVWFRLEKSFMTKLDRSVVGRRGPSRMDLTVEQLHANVCDCLREQGKPVPWSSWHRVKRVLSDVTGTPPRLIRRDSLLHADLKLT